jgi:hypothetical protein
MAGSPVVIAATAKHTATVREFVSPSFTLRVDQSIDINCAVVMYRYCYIEKIGNNVKGMRISQCCMSQCPTYFFFMLLVLLDLYKL